LSTEITRFLQRVERGNLVLGLVVILVSGLVLGFGHALLSMAIGVVLGALNFRVIAWIGRKVMRATPASRTMFFLLFVAKFGVLIALTYVLVVRVRVDVVPFIVGLSTLFVTLTVEAYRTMLMQGRAQAAGSDSPPANRE
jgi:hypothetical protein